MGECLRIDRFRRLNNAGVNVAGLGINHINLAEIITVNQAVAVGKCHHMERGISERFQLFITASDEEFIIPPNRVQFVRRPFEHNIVPARTVQRVLCDRKGFTGKQGAEDEKNRFEQRFFQGADVKDGCSADGLFSLMWRRAGTPRSEYTRSIGLSLVGVH